jgi:putative DNA primase/helicase
MHADALIEDGGFQKLVSTGDAVQLDQKFRVAERYVPFATHIIVGNVIPRVNDMTEATHNRLLLISFNWSIPPAKRDVDLLDKLRAEMPGILAWAIEGAK